MGKHVGKQQYKFEINDSLIIIVAVIALLCIGDYLSGVILLLLHQIFMFFSTYMLREYTRLPDSGNDIVKKIYKYATPFLIGLSILIGVVIPIFNQQWVKCVRIAVILLLLSCQYRLIDSLNYSLQVGINKIDELGVSIENPIIPEIIGKADSLILNKTGTLTEYKFTLLDIVPKSISESQFLNIATNIESKSNHPIAVSIGAKTLPGNGVEITEIPGKGISGKYFDADVLIGNATLLNDYSIKCDIPNSYGSAVHLGVNGEYCGYMLFENKAREGTFDYIEQIKDAGFTNLYLFSNDLQSVVQPISQALGFSVFKAECGIDEKCSATDYIVENKHHGSYVVYAGDIDEIESGMHADVFIGLGMTVNADVCIPEPGLSALPELFRISKRIIRTQNINMKITIAVKCFILFMTIIGITYPLVSIFMLFISTIFTFLDNYERIRL